MADAPALWYWLYCLQAKVRPFVLERFLTQMITQWQTGLT